MNEKIYSRQMNFRPEYDLTALRESSVVSHWLRTDYVRDHLEIDSSKTSFTVTSDPFIRHSCPLAVTHVVVEARTATATIAEQGSSSFLVQHLQQIPWLITLDLRLTAPLTSNHLLLFLAKHCLCIERLYLPPFSSITQEGFATGFHQLTELSACGSDLLHVNFCSSTLQRLHAGHCSLLSDDGLRNATLLEVLHVQQCYNVTTIAPFAHRLLELNASGSGIPINDEELKFALRLQVLHVSNSRRTLSLDAVARTLRELVAESCHGLKDANLIRASKLVKLHVSTSDVTTVAPFASTLLELQANGCYCGINTAGLRGAENLTSLSLKENRKIGALPTEVTANLLHLTLNFGSNIGDETFQHATQLVSLSANGVHGMTTMAPFGNSLRHLVLQGPFCSLADPFALHRTPHLVHLNLTENSKLTSIGPSVKTLQSLVVVGAFCGMSSSAEDWVTTKMPELRMVMKGKDSTENTNVHRRHLEEGLMMKERQQGLWLRPTTTTTTATTRTTTRKQ